MRYNRGFTIVEALVGTALLAIVFTSLYTAFVFGIKIVGNSRAKSMAIFLANQKIEEIRTLEYNDIGTVGGIPSGVLPESEEITMNGITFTIKTTVLYYDDPLDGLSPEDTLSTDYKKVRVNVSWSNYFGGSVKMITNISPPGIETTQGGGTLKIYVLDADGEGVPQADIHIVNNNVSPAIDAQYQSDDDGLLIIAGAPTSTEGYEITVTKPGFSQDRTYTRQEIANPSKPPLSVFESQVTEATFSIDRLSTFQVETRGYESFDDDFGNWSKIADSDNVTIDSSEVLLNQTPGQGFVESITISPLNLVNWDRLEFEDEKTQDTSIKYQILYYSTSSEWVLVPDADLPGNSQGFESSPVDLSSLDIQQYSLLRVKATLESSVADSTPYLDSWHLIYNTPLIGETAFHLEGAKILGYNSQSQPVPKYSQDHQSTLSGLLTIENLEWDSYTFSATSTTGMDLISVLPSPQPVDLLPDATTTVKLYFKAENTLLVRVQDASSSDPVFAAGVRLSNESLGYDKTQPTTEQGTSYFIPLENAVYDLEVYSEGYETTTTTVSVSGDTVIDIYLRRQQ